MIEKHFFLLLCNFYLFSNVVAIQYDCADKGPLGRESFAVTTRPWLDPLINCQLGFADIIYLERKNMVFFFISNDYV